MKRKTILIFTVALLTVVFSFDACKQADTTTGTLTVLVSDGVSGTPTAGAYTLVIGDQLQYSFTLNAGYSKLTVLFDGAPVAASGTVSITGKNTLHAYADDKFQYALTVILTDGVLGTPAAGTHSYLQGTLVDYSYTMEDGYSDLLVLLDDVSVENSGTVAMSGNHKLSVTATAGKNIQGSWLLTEIYDDDSTFDVVATFAGSYSEGTVTDSHGGSGTYTFIGSTVTFNLVFPDITYEYLGYFSDNDTMKGTCKRYQVADNVINGSWMATRKTAAASQSSQAGAVDMGRKGDVAQKMMK